MFGFYGVFFIVCIFFLYFVIRVDGLGRLFRFFLFSKLVGYFGEDIVCFGCVVIYGFFNLCLGEVLIRFVFIDRFKIGRLSM